MRIVAQVGNTGRTENFYPQGVSPHQFEILGKIVEDPNFNFLCIHPWEENRKQGPISFVWYSRDGVLHNTRVGINRVLREVVA